MHVHDLLFKTWEGPLLFLKTFKIPRIPSPRLSLGPVPDRGRADVSPADALPGRPPASPWPRPASLAAPTEGRSPVAFASPAVPAGRRVQEAPGQELSGPSHFRGARRV